MSTLEKVKSLKSDMPYQTPLKAVLLGIEDKFEYRNKVPNKNFGQSVSHIVQLL